VPKALAIGAQHALAIAGELIGICPFGRALRRFAEIARISVLNGILLDTGYLSEKM
jgi:hypothetical protein